MRRNSKATFVAVHGAMHGGWAWGPVRRLLAAQGHDLIAPTLTGQGERANELTAELTASDHVKDVLDCLWFENVEDAILVLHSYSGILAGPIAEAADGRLRAVILAGGFYARPGQSLLDVEPPETAARYREIADETGDGWRLPASDAFLAQWGVTDPEMAAFVGPRLTDFALGFQTEAIEYDPAPLARLDRVYVEHTDPPLPSLAASIRAATEDGFTRRAIATGHDMMLADPEATAALLIELAG